MLKSLVKKQFLEIGSLLLYNKKSGKSRSKNGIIGFAILMIFAYCAIGFSFFGLGTLLASTFIPLNLNWLYYSIIGLIAIALGVFGEVFSTYSIIYRAKDNDLLLSMPIEPYKILLARTLSIYLMGLLYSSAVYIPASIAYFMYSKMSVAAVACSIVLLFVLALFVLFLSLILGFIVALISGKARNKTFVTVFFSLLLLGVYYFCYFKLNTYLQYLATNAASIGAAMKTKAYPLYIFGLAGTGSIPMLLLISVSVIILFIALYWILSKTFIRIAIASAAHKKSNMKSMKSGKRSTIQAALFRKEWKRFWSCAAYVLNTGLGLFIMVALGVFACIRKDQLLQVSTIVSEYVPTTYSTIPAILCMVLCLILSMNCFTAPSISLEGKNIWILQSMPIDPMKILQAKINTHLVLNLIPAYISTICFGIAFDVSVLNVIGILLCISMFTLLSAEFGLRMNLKSPNLTWTNETVPIKQSMSVVVTMFSGWGIAIVLNGLYYIAASFVPFWIFALVISAVLGGLSIVVQKWLKETGVKIFISL